eukprot:s719_g23.t2
MLNLQEIIGQPLVVTGARSEEEAVHALEQVVHLVRASSEITTVRLTDCAISGHAGRCISEVGRLMKQLGAGSTAHFLQEACPRGALLHLPRFLEQGRESSRVILLERGHTRQRKEAEGEKEMPLQNGRNRSPVRLLPARRPVVNLVGRRSRSRSARSAPQGPNSCAADKSRKKAAGSQEEQEEVSEGEEEEESTDDEEEEEEEGEEMSEESEEEGESDESEICGRDVEAAPNDVARERKAARTRDASSEERVPLTKDKIEEKLDRRLPIGFGGDEAMADAVTTLRTEMGRKASHEQLEDLEHQQCKAFERFVGRWEACAEARRRNLQDEVSSAICEVQRPAAKASEGLRPGEARLPAERVSAASANRLEDLCQMQTQLKRELAGLRTEMSNQVSQLKLEGATEARPKSTLSEHWEQRYQSLSATVESLKVGLEATRRSIKETSAMREQAWLDGLRLRVDACAEGVASEVRIREESTQRLESLLQKTRQDLEAKIDAVGGDLEKQFNGVLASQNDKGLHLELMGAMQLELQKRQDAETSLRDLQCEMVEMRSKLLRKEHALLEATGFKEPSREVAREPSKEEPTTWRPGLTGTLFAEPTLSREPAPSNGPSPETGSPLSDLRASSTPGILRPKLPPRFQQWPT